MSEVTIVVSCPAHHFRGMSPFSRFAY